MSQFVRGFRLHLKHGRVLDGAEFPNGRVIVMDDPEWGLCSGARTAGLLTVGYPDSRIEWAEDGGAEASEPLDEAPAEMAPLAHQDAEQQASDSTGSDEPVPAQPQQSTLRDRYAAAIYERNNPGCRWADAHPDDLIAYRGDADAVMAVLPEQPDTADEPETDEQRAGRLETERDNTAGDHQQLSCSLWLLSRGHAPHTWQPQPGMPDVHCPGEPHKPAVAEPQPEADR
ncbi:hypothetical protein [Streptomyces sp. NPDC056707]|uniref:hypothetical protein n=1 Tax=Streptomyces sp. NPDC056707 TaxID=3345919 RepID=UPI0036B83915